MNVVAHGVSVAAFVTAVYVAFEHWSFIGLAGAVYAAASPAQRLYAPRTCARGLVHGACVGAAAAAAAAVAYTLFVALDDVDALTRHCDAALTTRLLDERRRLTIVSRDMGALAAVLGAALTLQCLRRRRHDTIADVEQTPPDDVDEFY